MSIELYEKARKRGQKTYKQNVSVGRYPFLPVLDDIIQKETISSDVSLGLVDVPLDRVVGTSTAGRTQAFASDFMPLMDSKTEFGAKWSKLCDAHLEEGIRDPIKVYEYLNYYYVVEGNKRVSVLKFFGADSIPAFVTRKVPRLTDDETIKVYYEFMDFYKKTGVNFIWFSHTGGYERLMEQVRVSEKHGGELGESTTVSAVGTASDSADGSGTVIRQESTKIWSDDTLLELKAAYKRFEKAYKQKGGDHLLNVTTGDAFVVFLELRSFDEICEMGLEDIEAGISSMWQEFLVVNEEYEVEVSLDPPEERTTKLSHILAPNYSASKPLKVAFIYGVDPAQSDWFYAHELGRNYVKEEFGDRLVSLKISGIETEQDAIDAMTDLIENQGVEVIFTPTVKMVGASLKCAIKYPNVRILNCSINTTHRYIRTYDARLYEAKFLSGMIAGALTETGKIGYLADYPIYGITANINAFALGARMVNPSVKVHLKWTTLKEVEDRKEIYKSLYEEGIDYVSDQDMITPNEASRNFGMYKLTADAPENMTMTVYNWGVLYKRIISMIMNGNWSSTDTDSEGKPINYWWGLSAGVVDIIVSDKVPSDTRRLVNIMKEQIIEDRISPFTGEIKIQSGEVISKEGEELDVDDIIKMNWLVENVVGEIPVKDELDDIAKELVEIKGVQKDTTNEEV